MMDNTRIDAAVASAQVALASEEFSWIRDSALRERPYVFGLLEGLRALADNEHQVDRLLPRLLLPTLHTRRADAPVTSTETWRAFEEFRGLLMGEDAETPAVLAAKDRLLSRVANLERHWAALIGSVKEALEAAGFKSEYGGVTMKAENETPLGGDESLRMQKLIDALESLDDVQDVYTSVVLDD